MLCWVDLIVQEGPARWSIGHLTHCQWCVGLSATVSVFCLGYCRVMVVVVVEEEEEDHSVFSLCPLVVQIGYTG